METIRKDVVHAVTAVACLDAAMIGVLDEHQTNRALCYSVSAPVLLPATMGGMQVVS